MIDSNGDDDNDNNDDNDNDDNGNDGNDDDDDDDDDAKTVKEESKVPKNHSACGGPPRAQTTSWWLYSRRL